jgi:hypothetical protein
MRPAKGWINRKGAHQENKLEAKYRVELERREAAGEVQWYLYESIKLRLADNTWYTPDYAVMAEDGTLEMHEVKGGLIMAASRVKIKVAATQFPYRFVQVTARLVRDGGGWDYEYI